MNDKNDHTDPPINTLDIEMINLDCILDFNNKQVAGTNKINTKKVVNTVGCAIILVKEKLIIIITNY